MAIIRSDPTYVKEQIDANPTWKIAHLLSEHFNDSAPIGWGCYIPVAEQIRDQIVRAELAMFAGYLSGSLPELHDVEIPRIAEIVDRFIDEGKQTGQ